jgi:hypothetical protein
MRTKTLALSALLGALSSASLVAQTNVYSLNAVGYINVTMPPGYTILTDPLIASPDNTLNTVLNDGNSQYAGASVFPFINGGSFSSTVETGNPFQPGWENGGSDVSLTPGQAVFFYNPGPGNMTATFVGTVPQGSLTNTLPVGYSLVASIVPTSGDLVTNSITQFSVANSGDIVYFFNPATQLYESNTPEFEFGSWSGGDPTTGDPVNTNVAHGFFYYNAGSAGTETWVENFSINP